VVAGDDQPTALGYLRDPIDVVLVRDRTGRTVPLVDRRTGITWVRRVVPKPADDVSHPEDVRIEVELNLGSANGHGC
jgi:hypothetical protein